MQVVIAISESSSSISYSSAADLLMQPVLEQMRFSLSGRKVWL